jgi:peptidyl-prolyl cis-trans isomerase SurA
MQNKILSILFFISLLSCKSNQHLQQTALNMPAYDLETPVEPIIYLGEKQINEKELRESFTDFVFPDSADYQTAVTAYLNKKRLYLEAEARGYGRNDSHLEEIESYTRVLAKSFIVTPEMTDDLAKTTYERLKWELNTSHILLAVNLYADPADTLKAFQSITSLRNEIMNGASFDSLAVKYSADINTRDSGGNMGWFSALQLIYPLEDASYALNIGEISHPVRTSAGYHLIRLNNKRSYSGQVRVKHILKGISKQDSPDIFRYQKNKIDSLYNLLSRGANFDELCLKNSDDLFSRENGGLLDPFSIGSRVEENFEKTAFALQPGQISKPIRSDVGWHIIKLVERIPLQPYEELEDGIISKVTTDTRGQYLKALGMRRFLSDEAIQVNNEVWENVLNLADVRINQRKWTFDNSQIEKRTLLKIGDTEFTNLDFLRYAQNKQSFEQQPQGFTPKMYFRWYFNSFKDEVAENYVLKHLLYNEPTFGMLAQLYKEDVLSTNLFNTLVLERSVTDTLGHRQYYQANIHQYLWPKKATATIVKANRKELLEAYQTIINGSKPYRLKRGILPIYFQKEEVDLEDTHKRKLAGLLQIMDQNKSFIVEVGGHNDINEEPGTSRKRVQSVVDFLTSNGLPITRIIEYDYGTTNLVDRFDWPQNQRVSFQFFSNDNRDIADILTNEADTIAIARGNYFEGDNIFIDSTKWQKGSYEAELDKHHYLIEIEKIIPPTPKAIREVRGNIIKEYKSLLEKQLKEELAVKYPVTLDEEKLKLIFNELKEKY